MFFMLFNTVSEIWTFQTNGPPWFQGVQITEVPQWYYAFVVAIHRGI